ncbi:putative reverse transcriptase domain-containing protein [Tanacetum coccineum]|uniref:Reverse transcriptase domain-containing protein n=1 Tax=Tanacetum coccineum TaxID=301880 RepID=A0ABQ5EEF3_9ASTR
MDKILRVITCFVCGVPRHYKSDCPKLKSGIKGDRDELGIAGIPPIPASVFQIDLIPGCWPVARDLIDWPPIRNEGGVVGPIESTFRQGFIRDPVLTWGARSVCQEETMIFRMGMI